MDDLISRQALCEYALNQKDKSVTPNDIMRFPPAQPTQNERVNSNNPLDCISRQAAIDALMPIYKSASLRNRNVFSTARKCMAAIEDLPSAGGCQCPCAYREPCDYCHYDAYRGHGCPAEEGLKDE